MVAGGHLSEYGEHYIFKFAPTVHKTTLRILFALVAQRNLHCHSFDYSAAFLNAKLDIPVYLKQHPYFVDQQHPDWVCYLTTNTYGLVNGSYQWY